MPVHDWSCTHIYCVLISMHVCTNQQAHTQMHIHHSMYAHSRGEIGNVRHGQYRTRIHTHIQSYARTKADSHAQFKSHHKCIQLWCHHIPHGAHERARKNNADTHTYNRRFSAFQCDSNGQQCLTRSGRFLFTEFTAQLLGRQLGRAGKQQKKQLNHVLAVIYSVQVHKHRSFFLWSLGLHSMLNCAFVHRHQDKLMLNRTCEKAPNRTHVHTQKWNPAGQLQSRLTENMHCYAAKFVASSVCW